MARETVRPLTELDYIEDREVRTDDDIQETTHGRIRVKGVSVEFWDVATSCP